MTEPFVVVVGATGDLGGRIARALVRQGTRTRALVRREGAPMPAGVESLTVDFSDVPA